MMRATLWLSVVSLGACGGPRGAPLGPPQPPAQPACISYQQAIAETDGAEARNHAAYQRALAEQGLHEPDFTADYFPSVDETEWTEVDSSEGRTLLSPTTEAACGVTNPWRLAQEGGGKVYVAMIANREVATHPLLVCGCRADVPATCGGAAPQHVRWRWHMSSTSTYAGPLSVVVDHESVSTLWVDKRPDGSPCPEPQPPP